MCLHHSYCVDRFYCFLADNLRDWSLISGRGGGATKWDGGGGACEVLPKRKGGGGGRGKSFSHAEGRGGGGTKGFGVVFMP